MAHEAIAECVTDVLVCHLFLFLPHFDVICDLLLNRSITEQTHGNMESIILLISLLAAG